MINRLILVGRITDKPELRQTNTNKSVTNFDLAVNRTFGEKETDFFKIVVWGKTAEFVCQYVEKGDLLGLDGRLQTRNYENAEGQKVYITEMVAESVQKLTPKSESTQETKKQEKPSVEDIDISDSSLPF